MPKRLFDRLALFGWARLDSPIPTAPFRLTQRFREEAVAALHELLNLDIRGHSCPSRRPNRPQHYGLEGKAVSSFASMPTAAPTTRARSSKPVLDRERREGGKELSYNVAWSVPPALNDGDFAIPALIEASGGQLASVHRTGANSSGSTPAARSRSTARTTVLGILGA
jgi:hypothetical protein